MQPATDDNHPGELGRLLRLAWPVVLAELAWMAMNFVDVIMVGRMPVGSLDAIGAVGLGSTVHFVTFIGAYGLLLSLDPLVSQAHGAGQLEDCQRSLAQGLYLAVLTTPPVMAITWLARESLPSWGVAPGVAAVVGPYIDALNWGTFPLLAATALRRYLQGLGQVRTVLIVMIACNLVNWAGNWALIFGKLGLPALGVTGSGWATTIARVSMALMLLGLAARHHRRAVGAWRRFPAAWDGARIATLLRLGLPASGHLLLEMGVFGAATVLVSRMDELSLAAHQVVLNIASFTFMVPLGISSAGAVRVGHLIGAGQFGAARRAGWMALGLGVGFMSLSGACLILFPITLLGVYTHESEMIRLGASLLGLAALFQIFDGAQVTATGVMRGAGQTRLPVISNLVAYWVIGLPIAVWLGDGLDWGVFGVWTGLTVGLAVSGLVLTAGWGRIARRLGSSKHQVPAHDQDRHVGPDVAQVAWPERAVAEVQH